MKSLFRNVTMRELLCFTIAAAALTQWCLHRSRLNSFADAYSQLQANIAEYDNQIQALSDLRVAMSESSDTLRIMQRHNVTHPHTTCGVYFDPTRKLWRATLVDDLPGLQSYGDSLGLGETLAQAMVEAESDFLRDRTTRNRVVHRIGQLVGKPCRVSYDEDSRLLKVQVSLEDDLASNHLDDRAGRRPPKEGSGDLTVPKAR